MKKNIARPITTMRLYGKPFSPWQFTAAILIVVLLAASAAYLTRSPPQTAQDVFKSMGYPAVVAANYSLGLSKRGEAIFRSKELTLSGIEGFFDAATHGPGHCWVYCDDSRVKLYLYETLHGQFSDSAGPVIFHVSPPFAATIIEFDEHGVVRRRKSLKASILLLKSVAVP